MQPLPREMHNFRMKMCALEGFLGTSWLLLGVSWGLLGTSWGPLGGLLETSCGPLGGLLATSCGPLGDLLGAFKGQHKIGGNFKKPTTRENTEQEK